MPPVQYLLNDNNYNTLYIGSPSGSTPIDALLQTSRQLSVLSSSSSSNSTATGQGTSTPAAAATPLVSAQLPRAKSALPARNRVRRFETLTGPLPDIIRF